MIILNCTIYTIQYHYATMTAILVNRYAHIVCTQCCNRKPSATTWDLSPRIPIVQVTELSYSIPSSTIPRTEYKSIYDGNPKVNVGFRPCLIKRNDALIVLYMYGVQYRVCTAQYEAHAQGWAEAKVSQ